MKISKKILVFVSLILVTTILATGCVPTSGDGSLKILRTNNSSEPGSLDPALAQGTHESWILDHIFEGLMKIDEDLKVVPAIAKRYEVSSDGLTYKFELRNDVKWSNGDPVTAHDFEFAWKRALDPELASDYAYQLYYIKGGEAYNNGEGTRDQVAVKALDDYKLEVVLEAPTAYFLELTAFYTLYPVSKKVVESDPDWAKNAETHVSNGPFTLTKWEHDAKIEIRKNENYYEAKKIKLDGIDFDIIDDENTTWQKYVGGDYDFLTPLPQAVVAQLKQEGSKELVIGAEVGTYYYNLNSKVKPFNNVKVRKGLAMTLDRQTIVDKIAQGGQFPAEGVVPFGLPDEKSKDFRDSVGNLNPYDVEKGKALFLEGLAEEGMTIADFKNIVLLYNTSEAHKKIAQAAQEMWRVNLGIEVQLENVEFQVKLDREKAGEYHISRAGWIGDYMDPITFIDLWYSTSSFNDAKYNNPKYDQLVNTIKTSSSQKERFDAMKEAEKILMEDMPVIPVYFYTQPYAQKSYVTGVYKPLVNYPKLTYADIKR